VADNETISTKIFADIDLFTIVNAIVTNAVIETVYESSVQARFGASLEMKKCHFTRKSCD
jgi:hypothetical protein